MANPKHLRLLLKAGVAGWNHWRMERPDIWPDLLGASLRGINLDDANLENANLHRADLEGASLVGARLRNANLKDSNLRCTRLTRAVLQEANLYNADMQDADLERTNLRDANLAKARLDGARLHLATFDGTGFDSGLVAGAFGIDTIHHKEPWSINIRTLRESAHLLADKPHLRDAAVSFYRNAHVPEQLLVEHFGAARRAHDWYTCFVSYSHQDEDFAAALCQRLESRRINYWRDAGVGIMVGSDILAALTRAIVAYDKVLLCCSQHSLTSSWVEAEIGLALEKERQLERGVLLPLDLDGYVHALWRSPHAPVLGRRMTADFIGWQDDAAKLSRSFEQVVRALRVP